MWIFEVIMLFVFFIGVVVGVITENRTLKKWFNERINEFYSEKDKEIETLKAKLCDSSEYCAYCDELDMAERGHFTCKYKKKKIPAVCHWQVLTPAHFDDIPWTKNETLKK